MLKGRLHRGLRANLYFWRDHVGHEIDCMVELGDRLVPIEIKSGTTVTADYWKEIGYWRNVSRQRSGQAYVVHGGAAEQQRAGATVMGWKSFLQRIPSKI